jgi:hypothetical protein
MSESSSTSIPLSEKINLGKNDSTSLERPETMDPTSQAPPPFVMPYTTKNFVAGFNGRVNLNAQPSAGGFMANPAEGGFGYRTTVDASAGQDLMRGNWAENDLSKTFYSPENIKGIQAAVRKQVYDRSGEKRWVIDEQSVDELEIVMRSLYLQYAKNLEYDIPGQVRDLNRLVIDWCVPRILSEVGMYVYYLNDIDKMPTPMAHPISMSSAGSKSLPFRKFM